MSVSPLDNAPPAADPFDLSLGSPLPATAPDELHLPDPLTEAEQRASLAAEAGDPATRTLALLNVADAWLALDAVAPALAAVRLADRAAPGQPAVLERLAGLLAQA